MRDEAESRPHCSSLKRTRLVKEKWRKLQSLRHPRPEEERSDGFQETLQNCVNKDNLVSVTVTGMT
jgi:hypothetical protein